jgi:hypothetical protein
VDFSRSFGEQELCGYRDGIQSGFFFLVLVLLFMMILLCGALGEGEGIIDGSLLQRVALKRRWWICNASGLPTL